MSSENKVPFTKIIVKNGDDRLIYRLGNRKQGLLLMDQKLIINTSKQVYEVHIVNRKHVLTLGTILNTKIINYLCQNIFQPQHHKCRNHYLLLNHSVAETH